MNKCTIKNWPEEDRPREKLLLKGFASLSDAELLAILIRSGSSNESAVQLARRILLSVDNNLNKLAKLKVSEISEQFHGMGEAKAISIVAALELGKRRRKSEVAEKNKISSSRDAWLWFYPLLADLSYEELWALFLDRSGAIIKQVRISQGGVSGTSADVRIILKSAIECLASGVILCHNHPSGNLKPSLQDDQLTERVKKAAKLLDISLLDHVILTDGSYFSYGDEARIL